MQTTRWSETDQRSHINTTEQNNTAHRQIAGGLVETTNENEMKTEKMAPITGTENQMKEKSQINPETDPGQTGSGSENMKTEVQNTQTKGESLPTSLLPTPPMEPGATTEGGASAKASRRGVPVTLTILVRRTPKGQGANTECSKSTEPGIQNVPDVQNTETATRTQAQQGVTTYNASVKMGTTGSGASCWLGVSPLDLINDVRIPKMDQDPEKKLENVNPSFVVQGLAHSAGMVILMGFDALDKYAQEQNKQRRKEYLELYNKIQNMLPGQPFALGCTMHNADHDYWKERFSERLLELCDGIADTAGTQAKWERRAYGRRKYGVTMENMQNVSIQLSIAVATGKDFLGYESVRGDVVYLATRTSVKDVLDRVERLSAAMGCRVPEGLTVVDGSSGLREPARAILEQLEQSKPSMIIFEEERSMVNDEYCTELQRFINSNLHMSLLSKATGSTFVFVTHNQLLTELIPPLMEKTTTVRFTDSGDKNIFQLDLGTVLQPKWDWEPQFFVNYRDPLMVFTKYREHPMSRARKNPTQTSTESR